MKRKLLSGLLIIGLSLCLIAVTGCGASTTDRNDAGANSTELEESQNSAADSKAAEPDQSTQGQVQTGELRYSGTSSAENIKSISISFILSEDKSRIHDLIIKVKDFRGTAKITGATVSVEISGQTMTIRNEIPVDYEGDNQDISVGDNTIESLRFMEDGSADLILTYCYKETAPQAYEIPVPGIQFKLTSEPAPESD